MTRSDPDPECITNLLVAWTEGDESAQEALFSSVYDELRVLAERYLRRERKSHTLQPTALVHEAYLELVNSPSQDWEGRAHFFGVAARVIRRILVWHARRRNMQKREGKKNRLTLSDNHVATPQREIDVIALDEALTRLRSLHERQSEVVELRYFGGLTVPETARVLGVSERTVKGDWKVARSWIRSELSA